MSDEIIDDMLLELRRATEKFPRWPTDTFHALAVLNEEIGELNKAILQFYYEPGKPASYGDMRIEAIQSMAMLYRFITSLDSFQYLVNRTEQHFQVGGASE